MNNQDQVIVLKGKNDEFFLNSDSKKVVFSSQCGCNFQTTYRIECDLIQSDVAETPPETLTTGISKPYGNDGKAANQKLIYYV